MCCRAVHDLIIARLNLAVGRAQLVTTCCTLGLCQHFPQTASMPPCPLSKCAVIRHLRRSSGFGASIACIVCVAALTFARRARLPLPCRSARSGGAANKPTCRRRASSAKAWIVGTCNVSLTIASVGHSSPGGHGLAPTIRRFRLTILSVRARLPHGATRRFPHVLLECDISLWAPGRMCQTRCEALLRPPVETHTDA